MTQELADRIRRLRNCPARARAASDAVETINALVDLVGEMHESIRMVVEVGVQETHGVYSPKNNRCVHGRYGYEGCESCIEEHLYPLPTKAAPIAALKEEV